MRSREAAGFLVGVVALASCCADWQEAPAATTPAGLLVVAMVSLKQPTICQPAHR